MVGIKYPSPVDSKHRPGYHFLPPANWMNDPNAPLKWKGRYHLFYQHNPNKPVWGDIHWGHAVSDDLVHWEHLPIALSPSRNGPDEDGCWSGCAVKDEEGVKLIYTGSEGQKQLPCLAVSADKENLTEWNKYTDNPIIKNPPPGYDLRGFRDHSVWREGDWWYQVIGSGIKGGGGVLFLYKSKDLKNWEYIHPFLIGGSNHLDKMWECPQVLKIDDRYVLFLSLHDEDKGLYPAYYVGQVAEERFIPYFSSPKRLDYGPNYYATHLMKGENRRPIIWGWSEEGRSRASQIAAGWAGVMALPRTVSLDEKNYDLSIEPVSELKQLRKDKFSSANILMGPNNGNPLGEIKGVALELSINVKILRTGLFKLSFFKSGEGREKTSIIFNNKDGRISVDRSDSSLSKNTARDTRYFTMINSDKKEMNLKSQT